jgi:hypothetical protein
LRPLRRETPSHPGDLVLIVRLVRTFLQEQKTPEGAGDSTWGIAEVSWSGRCEKIDFPLLAHELPVSPIDFEDQEAVAVTR